MRRYSLVLALLALLVLGIIAPALAQIPPVNTTPTGCGTTGWPLVAGSPMQCAPALDSAGVYQAKAVVLGSGTGDKATIAIPATITRYQVVAVGITNCSTTPILAALGLWTGASASGTNIVAAATITGATSSSVIINSTIAGSVATTMLTAATIYINVTVANAAALTCDVGVRIQDWS